MIDPNLGLGFRVHSSVFLCFVLLQSAGEGRTQTTDREGERERASANIMVDICKIIGARLVLKNIVILSLVSKRCDLI